ncbi:class II glutamine amidotransferase [Couchioplanes caeruleus]|uniref:class II glutamine amidotransferase n=1 Tax=Couchioplanes caeruleus TaxID=56438 RepID=UPI0020BE52DB|nr:class II glutamine amidotransferase [Couchioplanes caeruleus]UQU67587.1 class II glutamine amidotransferase [Couchioplanes caeruleus]
MCRLFGMSAAPHRVRATFWLLDASDSLAVQSRREPDGVGLGTFDADGSPEVHKAPIAAYHDAAFAREARELRAATFIAHIRYASTGGLTPDNTHPFCQHDRLLAHNGVIGGLAKLEDHLGTAMNLVHGDTDSERLFALITSYADQTGDIGEAIIRAVRWVAANLPVYAVNLVLTTATDLWALRYPETHQLFVLRRAAGGPTGTRHLEHASAAGTVRVRSAELTATPAIVVASERMDEDPGWRGLDPGELLHVAADQHITSTIALDRPPAHPLSLAELSAHAQASQKPAPASGPHAR